MFEKKIGSFNIHFLLYSLEIIAFWSIIFHCGLTQTDSTFTKRHCKTDMKTTEFFVLVWGFNSHEQPEDNAWGEFSNLWGGERKRGRNFFEISSHNCLFLQQVFVSQYFLVKKDRSFFLLDNFCIFFVSFSVLKDKKKQKNHFLSISLYKTKTLPCFTFQGTRQRRNW